ncbi:MAG: methylenetetrahydrofolate reductase, partial [Bacteroidota bacterium]
MERMKDSINPLFSDVTWGAGGSTADLTLEIATHLQTTGHVANMHMTCTNMEKDGDPKIAVQTALKTALSNGVRNIVALRGDPPAGQEEWKAAEGGFTCALDLVEYMRENFGDQFGISVAGYPEGHPNAITEVEDPLTMSEGEKARSSTLDGKVYTCKDDDYKKEMDYLKKKIDAGGDFIITQMFFDTKVFGRFVKDCREWGINCPIVPGLMCINAYGGFCKMTKFCKTRVPEELRAKMDSIQDDADAVKAFGVEYGIQMCKELMEIGVDVLHFYTLNLEKVTFGILEGLGYEVKGTVDESDAKDQVAKGSAWARVGDKVKTGDSTGTVQEIHSDGSATILVDGQSEPIKA